MNTIAVIINGASLPYHVIHYAIDKAKQNSSGIFVLFLKGKHERSKGYGFPSDITASENSFFADQTESGDESMIMDNMQLVKQMIESEKISFHSTVKTNASVNEVAELITAADVVIVDKDFDDHTLLGDDKISLKGLKENIGKPIDLVADDN